MERVLLKKQDYTDEEFDLKPAIERVNIGIGATICMYSDRHACTIIEVSPSKKTIKIQRDKAIRIDDNGMSDSQTYEYERDEEGIIETARLNKNGVYKTSSKESVAIGFRREYFDYSF